ncbi:MAG: hypothetical protein QXG00_05200 [Candidatus Woesearchaeota archaeon]
MNKHAAIELSANIIVVVLISIVVIGLGIYIVIKVISNANSFECQYDDQKQKEIFNTLCVEERICASYMSSCSNFLGRDIPGHIGNGKSGTFMIGIQNNLGTDATFELIVNQALGPTPLPEENFKYIDRYIPFRIQNNEKKIKLLVIDMPNNAELGQYGFNVLVCVNQDTGLNDIRCREGYNKYDLKKIYITNT